MTDWKWRAGNWCEKKDSRFLIENGVHFHPLPLEDPSSPRQDTESAVRPALWPTRSPPARSPCSLQKPRSAQAVQGLSRCSRRGSQRKRRKVAAFPRIRHQGLLRGLRPAPGGRAPSPVTPPPSPGGARPRVPGLLLPALARAPPPHGPDSLSPGGGRGGRARAAKLTWRSGRGGVRVRGGGSWVCGFSPDRPGAASGPQRSDSDPGGVLEALKGSLGIFRVQVSDSSHFRGRAAGRGRRPPPYPRRPRVCAGGAAVETPGS